MMIKLAGYEITGEVYKSYQSAIYRAIDPQKRPVIIKLLHKDYPSEIELSYFQREFEITTKLNGKGIIKAYAIENYKNSLAIVLEDFQGISLAKSLKDFQLKTEEKLHIAIQIAEALAQIHKQNVIHKDINPSNIILNRDSNELKIIDFGISTELKREQTQLMKLNNIEGTLDYISPEQTGRMNRPIDHRTDLYSLGVTLYELFSGQLPFVWKDEAEIIYSHIAKLPEAPGKINSHIPDTISAIIMKLLNKNVEDRYQMASGLKQDLLRCYEEYKEKGHIPLFPLGQNDSTDNFQIPNEVYGRKEEIKLLYSTFDKITEGPASMLLVDGYPGIGKSTLIHEILKSISEKKGFFVSGKFDPLENNIPYSAFLQALQMLIRQILVEPEDKLAIWKEKILRALPHNGQVIIEKLPEVEQIIGPQNPVVELNPLGTHKRFLKVFTDFLRIFARQEHPLVIFLDDIQWSDASTLELLKYLFDEKNQKYLLVIGAYRVNEVKKGHPLLSLIKELEQSDETSPQRIHRLSLKPLKKAIVNQILADTFRCSSKETKELADLVYSKTKGNPFFTNQLLTSLYTQGIFDFNLEKHHWQWDLQKIKAINVSENVVDLLVQRLKTFSEKTLELLKIAASIGNHFDLGTLVLISQQTVTEAYSNLWPAVEKEIIYPLDNNYRLLNLQQKDIESGSLRISFSFQHDKIQQAVYSLIPEQQKPEYHIKIGREQYNDFKSTQQNDSLFTIVNHLNLGKNLIKDQNERIELLRLNILAGDKAKKAAAFQGATNYFETGKSLLSSEEWSHHRDKRFKLFFEHTEVLYLSGKIEEAQKQCEDLLPLTQNNLDKALIYELKSRILEYQVKFPEAIDQIREGLMLFDIKFPSDYQEIEKLVDQKSKKIQQIIGDSPREFLNRLPEMSDKDMYMAAKLLNQAIPVSRLVNPALYNILGLLLLEHTLKYGTTPFACHCYMDYAIMQVAKQGNMKTAYELGEAAFDLMKKLKADSIKTMLYLIFPYISYWHRHYNECFDYYDLAYRTNMEMGNERIAAHAQAHKLRLSIFVGKNLSQLKRESEKAISFLHKKQYTMPLELNQLILNIIQKFQTLPEETIGSSFHDKDSEIMTSFNKHNNLTYLVRFFQFNCMFNYIHDDLEAAELWNIWAEETIYVALTDYPLVDHYLYQSLIYIHQWKQAPPQRQKELMGKLVKNLDRFKKWSESCSANFAHKYYFLCAEMAILRQEELDTIMALYQKAISSIGDNDFINMKALINEAQGKFWLNRGNDIIGKAFIREAYYLYRQWGALRKAAMMENQYSHDLLYKQGVDRNIKASIHRSAASTSLSTQAIDMTSIVKSNQAISSEIKIDRLLKTLMYIIIEYAGAQRGSLLLINPNDDELYIEAQKTTDSESIEVMHSLPYRESNNLCPEIIQFVARSMKNLVLSNASQEGDFTKNSYIKEHGTKSVLTMPVIYQNSLKGIVYLENDLADSVFTEERINILALLSSQASISIENAKLYQNLEEKVNERTVQLKAANKKLKELSLLDPLTTLHNRRYIHEFISEFSINFIKSKAKSMNRAEKRNVNLENKVMGFFLIDLDHFKAVNDSYGHQAGDMVLVSISKTLKSMVRKEDFIVRWGGEEFLIILNNSSVDYMKVFPKKLLSRIRDTPIKISSTKTLNKTCSIGGVMMPFDLNNPLLLSLDQTINISDYALYLAKENGRDRAAFITLNKTHKTSEKSKHYFSTLSKDREFNHDFMEILWIQ